MKRLFFLIAMVGLFAISSVAQNEGAPKGKGKPQQGKGAPHRAGVERKGGEGRQKLSPDEKAKKQTEHLSQIVGLNADQSNKIQAINKAYIEKIQAIRSGKGKEELTEDQKMQIRELQKARFQEVKAQLSKEQIEKFKQHRKNKQAEIKSKGGKMPEEHEQPEDLKD